MYLERPSLIIGTLDTQQVGLAGVTVHFISFHGVIRKFRQIVFGISIVVGIFHDTNIGNASQKECPVQTGSFRIPVFREQQCPASTTGRPPRNSQFRWYALNSGDSTPQKKKRQPRTVATNPPMTKRHEVTEKDTQKSHNGRFNESARTVPFWSVPSTSHTVPPLVCQSLKSAVPFPPQSTVPTTCSAASSSRIAAWQWTAAADAP